MINQEKNCFFCEKKNVSYLCPKCGHFYCSIDCYKSQKHLSCSELFYKKCVEDEIKFQSKSKKTKDKLKTQTIEILKRQYQEYLNENNSDTILDLEESFNNLHLQNEDSIWNNLTNEQKQDFIDLIKKDEIKNLLPLDFWRPWYLNEKNKSCLIKEINLNKSEPSSSKEFISNLENNLNELNKKVPKIEFEIKKFDQLTKIPPSPHVKLIFINIIFSYCYICRFFNNDHLKFYLEAFQLFNDISLISKKSSFANSQETLQYTIQILINLKKINLDFILILTDDLKFILKNENKIFLNIISDLMILVLIYKKKLKHKLTKSKLQQVNNIFKKLEYYLSWSNENNQCLNEELEKICFEEFSILSSKKLVEQETSKEIKIHE